MQFKQNRIIISFSLLLIQVLSVFSAPLEKRTSIGYEEHEKGIFFKKPMDWDKTVYAYIYSDYVNELSYDAGRPLDQWPGKKMYYRENEDIYYVMFANKYFNHNSHVIFTDGKRQAPAAMAEGFLLAESSVYNENGLLMLCNSNERVCTENAVDIFYVMDPSWKNVYAHYKIGQGEWTEVPGKQMKINYFEKKHHLRINLGDEKEMTIVFTDCEGHWDNNNGMNYQLHALEDKVFGKF